MISLSEFVSSVMQYRGTTKTVPEIALSSVRSLAVYPGGTTIYTAGAEDNAIGVFSRDATTGALAFVEAQQQGVNGVEGLTDVNDVVVTLWP